MMDCRTATDDFIRICTDHTKHNADGRCNGPHLGAGPLREGWLHRELQVYFAWCLVYNEPVQRWEGQTESHCMMWRSANREVHTYTHIQARRHSSCSMYGMACMVCVAQCFGATQKQAALRLLAVARCSNWQLYHEMPSL